MTMAGTTGETAELEARIAELEASVKLREKLDRLEDRARRGPGLGSPQAMRTKAPPRAIGGGGGDWDRLRSEWIRAGNYEPL
jgi:hypothetical protein